MRLIRYINNFLIHTLIIVQIVFLTSCNSKHQTGNIGFLGFNLDMEYLKAKSVKDSLLNIRELNYFETTDELGNKQKNLYYNFSGISPSLFAKINLRGSYIVDERLTSIQLTLCNKSATGEQRFSYTCDLNELKRLFEIYKEKYGRPTLLGQGERYDWLSRKIPNVYLQGPKGRWAMDKIFFWEKGNFIIYFDFGYPEINTTSVNPNTKSDVSRLNDSTGAPIIYYDFTQDYLDELLKKAGGEKAKENK
jgi:hypothetical protein